MTRHLASTRSFPATYGPLHPTVSVTPAFPGRPCSGGALVMSPLPVGPTSTGQPYLGMDPSAPATWVRPYNPQPGMISQLNFDGAKYQGDSPMGGTWHYPRPVRDRKLRRRKLWPSCVRVLKRCSVPSLTMMRVWVVRSSARSGWPVSQQTSCYSFTTR